MHEAADRLVVLIHPAPHGELPMDTLREQLSADVDHSMTVELRTVDAGGFLNAGRRKHVDLIALGVPALDARRPP